MKIDRKAMREKLAKRTQESYERKDGGISVKYFNAESDLPLWKCDVTKDEPHIIDIIPFKAGDNFPQIDRRNPIEKGEDVYVLDIFVHTNVGPGKEMVVCPTKNYSQPCPICEEIERMINEDGAEWEDYSTLAAKRRCAYNIICYDTDKQEKKGIQIWEVSHKYSEKILTALAKNSAARGGGVIAYSDPSKGVGQSISFEVAGDTYRTVSGHKLLPRDYDIADDIIESAYSLDDHIVVLSYDEIKEKAFRKTSDSLEDRGGRRSRGKDKDDEDEKPLKRRQKTIEKEDDDIDDEKVFSKKKTSRGKVVEDEEEIDEEEIDEEENQEDHYECPANGEFGIDFDKYQDCDDCEIFDACKSQAESLARQKAKAKKPVPRRR